MFSYVPQMGRGGFCNMDNTITTITGVIYLLSSVITTQIDNKRGVCNTPLLSVCY